ncbi:MAG: OmpH family outer membrane protein [Alphaproteobacteria bacterium]|nr:OmpH family outer membrane protein [Alphaproteobacteria bacterium]
MLKKMKIKQVPKNYAKMGMIGGAVIVVALLAALAISRTASKPVSVEHALTSISSDSVTAAELRIAVVRMDEIQNRADILSNLRKQKESFEARLRDELTKTQKALEKERDDIEKSQDMLSREALQRRVADYQQRVGNLQRDLTERAQSIEMEFQKALVEIQKRDLDPIIEGITAKKNLSLVIDGRFARVAKGAPTGLDITDEVIAALNKRASNFKMGTPKGF